jgi:2-methylcitrate dehydratase
MSAPTISERFAETLLSIDYDALPDAVIHQAKRQILDTLACALGAYSSAPAKLVRDIADELGGNPQSTLLGEKTKTSMTMATFCNGTMIRYLDFNDYYFHRDPGHPSSNLSLVLAVAEAKGLNGRDVILGVVTAYEAQLRVCTFCGEPNLWDRGWRGSATNVLWGSTAAAAQLLGLSQEATADAFGISASHNSALAQSNSGKIAMMKATAEATVAKAGLEAAMLAGRGLSGPGEIFEGKYGWINVVAGGADFEGLIAPIHDHYKIMDICMKPYAAEMMTQSSVQAAIDLVEEHNFDPAEAEKIQVLYHEYALRKPSWDKTKFAPTTRETADHSFPYCVAVSLLDRACGPEQFTDEKIFDPTVAKVISKIELGTDEELTKLYRETFGTKITITMPSGEVFQKACLYPPGHPKNPISDEQVAEKFRYLARDLLKPDQIERCIEAVWALDSCEDLTGFMETFAA